MPYEVEEKGALERRVHVTVPASAYKREHDRQVQKLGGNLKMSGFRKGKVPASVVRGQYGKALVGEVIEELINAELGKVLDEIGSVIHVEQPDIDQMPSAKKDLRFHVDVEVRPEVDPIGYMGIEVERPHREVDEEMMSGAMEELREAHAIFEPIVLREEVRNGDVVEFDIEPLGDERLQDLSSKGMKAEVGAGEVLAPIEEALVGARFNSKVEAEIELPEDYPIEDLQGEKAKLRLTIRSVSKRVLPELDDALAAKTGMGETLLEVRGEVRKRLAAEIESRARQAALGSLVDALLEAHPIELPPRFIDVQVRRALAGQLQQMTGQQIDPSRLVAEDFAPMREGLRPQVERDIKAELVVGAIAKKEDVELNREEFDAFLRAEAARYDLEPSAYAQYVRSREELSRQKTRAAILDKTLERVLSEASVVEVEWPSEEE